MGDRWPPPLAPTSPAELNQLRVFAPCSSSCCFAPPLLQIEDCEDLLERCGRKQKEEGRGGGRCLSLAAVDSHLPAAMYHRLTASYAPLLVTPFVTLQLLHSGGERRGAGQR